MLISRPHHLHFVLLYSSSLKRIKPIKTEPPWSWASTRAPLWTLSRPVRAGTFSLARGHGQVCLLSNRRLPSWKTSSRLEGSGSETSRRAAAASSSRTWVCQWRLCRSQARRFSQEVGLSTEPSMAPGQTSGPPPQECGSESWNTAITPSSSVQKPPQGCPHIFPLSMKEHDPSAPSGRGRSCPALPLWPQPPPPHPSPLHALTYTRASVSNQQISELQTSYDLRDIEKVLLT